MGRWERVAVAPDFQGYTRREREGGHYLRYHPSPMPTAYRTPDPALGELVTDASARVAALGQRLRDRPSRLLYATLLRSESIASSWIEGLRDTPRNVLAARLDEVHGLGSTSHEVLRNIDAMSSAVTTLARSSWKHTDIHAVHDALLPHDARSSYRDEQVFIGGRSPLTASYVAPPHGDVTGLMDDLLGYVRSTGDPPLVAAALLHAQFETIHPYPDGNGRTGRALFHAYLARSGLVDHGVLPLSLVLRDDTQGYVDALTGFRTGSAAASEVDAARGVYLTYMLNAVLDAAQIADATFAGVDDVLARWGPHVGRLRADSSIHRLLDVLVEQPVVTPGYVMDALGVTRTTASNSLVELARVGIVQRAGGRFRRQVVYQANDVLAILDRHIPGPPTVTVTPMPPVAPVRRYGGARCGALLSRKGVPCTRTAGHPGPCRAL